MDLSFTVGKTKKKKKSGRITNQVFSSGLGPSPTGGVHAAQWKVVSNTLPTSQTIPPNTFQSPPAIPHTNSLSFTIEPPMPSSDFDVDLARDDECDRLDEIDRVHDCGKVPKSKRQVSTFRSTDIL